MIRTDARRGGVRGEVDLVRDLTPIQEATDVRDLLEGLAQSAVGAVDADACVVSLVDDDRDLLRTAAAATVAPHHLDVLALHFPMSRFPLVRRVVETGRGVEVAAADPGADVAERRLLVEAGFARALITRLAVDGRGIGVVRSLRKGDRPFRPQDPGRVDLLASFAATAYSRLLLAAKLEAHQGETVGALCSALEARDPYTRAHNGRIHDLAVALAKAMRLSPEERRDVALGAILHDVGKIGVADAILRKPGRLNEWEWQAMRRHPSIGYDMLRGIDFLARALPIVRHHHERWDGRGYPDGLAGEEIPLAARIVSVCDAFDAMTSDRAYRPARPVAEACEEIIAGAGAQFDPRAAAALVALVCRGRAGAPPPALALQAV